jgi:membrane associated rhomboid family serine protease
MFGRDLPKAPRLGWKVLSEVQLNNAKYAGRPSMCRNCGALVGTDETVCSLCGAPKQAAATPPQAQAPSQNMHDHEAMRFARAILDRPYIFTLVFIVANIFVFLLTSQAGANENAGVLIPYGAKVNTLIDRQQEWWRFVTPMFLHANVLHLFMNMYGLWMIGRYVERLYGSAKFVFFWVVTGIAGVVASYLSVQPGMQGSGPVGRFFFKAGDSISVGASGALFGLIGVLFVFGIRFRHELPEGFKRAFGVGMLPTILLNIYIGYMVPVIDNAAHMGGLVAGALLALVIGYKRPGERSGVAFFWHILQIAALALVALSFSMVIRNFNQPYAELADVTPALLGNESLTFVDAINEGRNALILVVSKEDASGVDKAIKALENAPSPDQRSGELQKELKSLLGRAKSFMETSSSTPAQQRARVRLQLYSDTESWIMRFNRWAKTEGDNYDIYITPSGEDSPAKK